MQWLSKCIDDTMSVNLSNYAILIINGADYCSIITGIGKSEAINLMQNIDLSEKKLNIMKYKNLFSNINMDKEMIKFGDIEIEKQKFYCLKIPIF